MLAQPMTTSDAAMRSPGVTTTPKHDNYCEVEFSLAINLIRFAGRKKPLTIRLPYLFGSAEDEWGNRRGCEGEICEARYSKLPLVTDFNQADFQ